MSLQSWWSLNGITSDNSPNKNNLTNYGATISNEGKIGKCFLFNESFMSAKNYISDNSFSICAWVNPSDSSNKAVFSSRTVGANGVTVFILNNIVRFDTGLHQWTTNISIPINTWTHITCVCSPSSKKLFINGKQVANINISTTIVNINTNCYIGSSPVGDTGHGNYFKGLLNDIRVFNHTLSDKEIYDISLANILHYSFNYQQEATINITPFPILNEAYKTPGSYAPGWDASIHSNAIAVTNWGNGYNSGVTNASSQYHAYWMYDEDSSTPICCFRDLPNPNVNNTRPGWLGVSRNLGTPNDLNWTVGTYVSISVLAKSSVLNRGLDFGIYHTEGTSSTFNGSKKTIYCSKINEWEVLSFTFQVTSNWVLTANAAIYIYGTGAGASGISYWKYAQVEVKDHPTPIINGQNSPTIFDCSGFNNHGRIVYNTTPEWWADSKVCKGSYLFKGAQYITTPQFLFTSNQDWSVSAWVKITEYNNESRLDNINLGNKLSHYSSEKPLLYANDGTNDHYVYGSKIELNTWTHIAFVYSFSKKICRIYKNGYLDASSNNMSSTDIPRGFQTNHFIGQNTKGYISDYRVYGVSLEPEDILSIYKSVIEIDNQGNLYCYDYDSGNNITDFTSKGFVLSNDISEAFTIGKTYLLDDSSNTQIIEGEWNPTLKKMQYKALSTFNCLGSAFPITWNSDINIEKYRPRVVLNIENNKHIFCSEINEF